MGERVKEGDRIALISSKHCYVLEAVPGMVRLDKRLTIDGGKIIGSEYGERYKTPKGREFWILRPTVHDMFRTMERGPQALTPKDIGQILVHLDIRPGAVVVECGLGSGSLTLALLRFVAPSGKVVSIEREKKWIEMAGRNIEKAGLSSLWSCHQGDIYEDKIDSTILGLEHGADALILDLPEPWNAMDDVGSILKPGGTLAVYVPSYNQVIRSVETFQASPDFGLIDIKNVRETKIAHKVTKNGIVVRPETQGIAHTGFLVFSRALKNQ